MTRLSAHGVTASVPPGWEARITRRAPLPGERTGAVTHLATFGLPEQRGDFGTGAVERMGPDDALVVLVEYDPAEAGTALFAGRGLPRLRPEDFGPAHLQRVLPGQSGCQRFFTVAGRPFCLFVVLGSHARRAALLARVQPVIAALQLSAPGPAAAGLGAAAASVAHPPLSGGPA